MNYTSFFEMTKCKCDLIKCNYLINIADGDFDIL